jgi:hypothetical protein
MKRQSKKRLMTINDKTDVKDMWAAVRQLTGRKQDTGPAAGITADSLNSHYVAISTNNHYTPPINKQSVVPCQFQYIYSWRVFQILDHLHPTAAGLDQLPAWFHKIGAEGLVCSRHEQHGTACILLVDCRRQAAVCKPVLGLVSSNDEVLETAVSAQDSLKSYF